MKPIRSFICSRCGPLTAVLLIVFGISASIAAPAKFLSGIPDLPLIAGLEEDLAAAVEFETASGRIAEAVASGPVDRRLILEFYAESLPQLGWRLQSPVRFQREGEILSLEIDPADGQTDSQTGDVTVHFKLVPAIP